MLIRRIRARRPASIGGRPPRLRDFQQAAEARTMPSHQRLGPDGRHCLHDRWKPPIQLQEEQAIADRELDPTAHLALKYNQLASKRGILSLKSADRSERRNQQPQKEEEQRDHRGRRYVIPSLDQTDEVFGTHRLSARRFAEYLSLGQVPDAAPEGTPPAALSRGERWVTPDPECGHPGAPGRRRWWPRFFSRWDSQSVMHAETSRAASVWRPRGLRHIVQWSRVRNHPVAKTFSWCSPSGSSCMTSIRALWTH